MTSTEPDRRTEVIDLGGLHFATQSSVVESSLGQRPGVAAVEANPDP